MSVSVVIPCFQQGIYLRRCLASIMWQLQGQDEIILVNDGEGNLGREVTQQFHDHCMVLDNGSNRGVSFSRNRGVKKAQAEWIKFLDADDVLCPFALEIVGGALAIPERTQVVTGGCHRIIDGQYRDYICANQKTLDNIYRVIPTLPSCTFIRRTALLEVGLFDERIDHEEDWDLWFRIFEHYGREGFQIVNQPICYYWVDERERRAKTRRGTVEGLPVRDYFRIRYGADPQ